MKSILRKEVIIGIVVIVTLVLLIFGINFLKGVNIFKATNYYNTVFTDAEGLAQSSPVTLNGFKVGIVREIGYDYAHPGQVLVELSLDKELRLPHGSTATVNTDILGTASVILHLGNAAEGFYAVGDTIPGIAKGGLMSTISQEVMPNVRQMMGKIDSLVSSLNALASNPGLHAAATRMDEITLEATQMLKEVNAILKSVRPAVGKFNGIAQNVDTITGNLATVSGQLSNANVDQLVARLQTTADNLASLTAKLNSDDSTIGLLSKDPSLYNNLNSAAASLDSLLVDVKANPKRYIHIKVF